MTEEKNKTVKTNIKLDLAFIETLKNVMKNKFNITCSDNADLVRTALRHFVMLYRTTILEEE